MTNEEIVTSEYSKGKTMQEIVTKTGIKIYTVRKILQESNMVRLNKDKIKQLSEEDKNKMVDLYLQGKTLRAIEREFPFSRTMITKVLKNCGIGIRSLNESNSKYDFNENYFENIDTEDKAYWLGFIYADGYLMTKRRENWSQILGITLSVRDISHLEKFKVCIGASNPIKVYKNKQYKGYEREDSARIQLVSQKLADDIKKYGVVEKKTKILTYPSNITKHLERHFIRGYLDGDGSIYYIDGYIRVNFLGTKEFLEGIVRYFGEDRTIYEDKGIYNLVYTKQDKIVKMLENLYYDSTIYLERKYEKFKQYA